MQNNVFLAKIVTFDNYSLLFEINTLTPSSEDYRLIVVYGKKAYDLQTKELYYVLNVSKGIIDNEDLNSLRNDRKYVYEKCPFIDIWEDIKEVLGVTETLDTFLEKCINDIEELNKILSKENKIIDLNKIRKLRIERK